MVRSGSEGVMSGGCQVGNAVGGKEGLRGSGFKMIKFRGEGIHSGRVDGERWLSL